MTVELKDIFRKDISRHIDGVIKADDMRRLETELEEYVVTSEVSKRLEEFVEAYNDGQRGNGVWISGFFGSGKSHLLKMLALLLENQPVGEHTPLSYFEPKFASDRIFLGNLQKAVGIPSRSILFNIDQQADVARSLDGALLSVFVKMFDNMQGFYGTMPHVANFERDLDREGHFDAFKAAFTEHSGKDWREARRSANMLGGKITEAYIQATGNDVPSGDLIRAYREDYSLSIDSFAERVRDYIDARSVEEPGFRLNFFVDEVGQYIADSVPLMTNLQTIAETLSTRCDGRAWIVVTAQQEMDTIVGEMSRHTGNDFSKIMGRFDTKLALNASDVAEVIQRRLLEKTDAMASSLGEVYDDHAENLRTMFDFADGTQSMKGFRDRDHFIRSYPFHPYQYELFQKAIRTLSDQNAFEGRHTSTGERSMLGAFQEVGRSMMHEPLGTLATFDQMYAGVEGVVKTSAKQAVITAQRQLSDAFAVRVLKALFLVKYVDEFKTTPRNVAILMQDRLDLDPTQHLRRVQDALELLAQQSYVERNGDRYEFLTDEEKDIEQRIRSTELDHGDVTRILHQMLFAEVLKGHKSILHETSGQEFSFTPRVHHELKGREHPVSINLITPFMSDIERAETQLVTYTMRTDELQVVLADDNHFVEELKLLLRTERYLTRNSESEQREGIAAILRSKARTNEERGNRIKDTFRRLLGDARILVRGEFLRIRTTDPKTRIEEGFQTLIDRTFPSLKMLRGARYTMGGLKNQLAITDDGQITEAEEEVFNRIKSTRDQSLRCTIKTMTELFEKPPRGWNDVATIAIIAALVGRGRIEVTSGGERLEGNDLEQALADKSRWPSLNLDPLIAIDTAAILKLKERFQEMFGRRPSATDGRDLSREMASGIDALAQRVEEYMRHAREYPLVTALTPFQETLAELRAKPDSWYLTDFEARADEILDQKEDIFQPVDEFMTGSQRAIVDDAHAFLQAEAPNLDSADATLRADIESKLAAPDLHKGNGIQTFKTQLDKLKSEIRNAVAQERARASEKIKETRTRLMASEEFKQADQSAQDAARAAFDRIDAWIAEERFIPSIRMAVGEFERSQYPDILSRLIASAAPEPQDGEDTSKPAAPITVIPISEIGVRFPHSVIDSEKDVDVYLETMRDAMIDAIRAGKRITP